LELICSIFKEYSELAACGSNDSTADFCDPFMPDSYVLCPNNYDTGRICGRGGHKLHGV
jgi:hypothetical protein